MQFFFKLCSKKKSQTQDNAKYVGTVDIREDVIEAAHVSPRLHSSCYYLLFWSFCFYPWIHSRVGDCFLTLMMPSSTSKKAAKAHTDNRQTRSTKDKADGSAPSILSSPLKEQRAKTVAVKMAKTQGAEQLEDGKESELLQQRARECAEAHVVSPTGASYESLLEVCHSLSLHFTGQARSEMTRRAYTIFAKGDKNGKLLAMLVATPCFSCRSLSVYFLPSTPPFQLMNSQP